MMMREVDLFENNQSKQQVGGVWKKQRGSSFIIKRYLLSLQKLPAVAIAVGEHDLAIISHVDMRAVRRSKDRPTKVSHGTKYFTTTLRSR